MNICVIGLGLIGGSFALAARSVRADARLVGVERDPANASLALELGLVDEVVPIDLALPHAELVVLAVPVDAIAELLPSVLDRIHADAVVLDFGSTKELICRLAADHPRRDRFVAAHPIAGTEHSGPRAAFASLLRGNVMILCERERSAPDAISTFEDLCTALQMKIREMTPAEHDLHLAYVSHLSHVSAFCLGLTVLEKEKDESNIFHMAGSGFSSTARLAMSSPRMWAPIFTQNARNVSAALESYIQNLRRFKETVDTGDESASTELMREANEIRRILSRIDIEGTE